MDGPVVIPEALRRPQQDVLHGGVRRRPRRGADEPASSSVPTALMRQGNFSEITHRRSGTRSRASRFPATSFPQSQLSPIALKLLRVLPGAEPCRARVEQLQGRRAQHGQRRPVLARVDQNLGNKVRLYVRYNWHDSFNSNVVQRAIPITGGRRSRASTRTRWSPTRTRCGRTCSTTSGSATTASTSTR